MKAFFLSFFLFSFLHFCTFLFCAVLRHRTNIRFKKQRLLLIFTEGLVNYQSLSEVHVIH